MRRFLQRISQSDPGELKEIRVRCVDLAEAVFPQAYF